jgi:starch synthase
MKKTLEMGGRFILVGSLHGSNEDAKIIEILSQYQDHPYLICELNTNAAMAERTYASSHAIIVPSLFEPCGLTQMIALRYGTVPMVRSTGGLKDTVFDIDTSNLPLEKRNGYSFDYPDHGGIDWVLSRAFKLYNENKEQFVRLSHQGFLENHGWDKSCDEYIDIYTILKETT